MSRNLATFSPLSRAPVVLLPRVYRSRRVTAWAAERWLDLLCLLLLGYALFGKGWAYVGMPPLFIGELTLLLGAVALAFTRGWGRHLAQSPTAWLLLVLVGWVMLRTFPYTKTYGFEAFRDAALVGYAAFALLAFALLMTAPARLPAMIARYRVFVPIFLVVAPCVWVVTRANEQGVPRWPGADVPVVHAKGGDVLTHLAGVFAFWVAGLARPRGKAGWAWLVLLAVNAMAIGAYSRAGLLSFMAAYALCFAFRSGSRLPMRLAAVVLIAAAVLGATGVGLKLAAGSKDREVSFSQLAQNLASMTGDSEPGELHGTKQWRLRWWRDICRYTLGGKYFWEGKGFGINLADEDGYQLFARGQGQLRSPHSGHLNVLARAGVPGLALWVSAQAVWVAAVFRRYRRAKSGREQRWEGLFFFLLAYWTAFMVNASFDVFLEGPMGGIWFWTLYGVGMAAVRLYDSKPELLSEHVGDDLEAARAG